MFKKRIARVACFLAMFSLMTCSALATDNRHAAKVQTGQSQQVGGINIYYGLLPAQIAGKHPVTHEEKTMHGGVPGKPGEYHLVVALFDAGGQRITDASVSATIGELGMTGIRKDLEPMRIGESMSFGNYFALRDTGIYRITIVVQRSGKASAKPVEALFDYRL